MKRLILLYLFSITYIIGIQAQDSRYVGTWKWHYDSPYEDGEEGMPPRDEYIKINIEDGSVWISIKMEGKDGNGHPFVSREEAEDIRVNSDGSISFRRYICKKEYDNDKQLYLTVWDSYTVRYAGGRLISNEEVNEESYSANGILVKSEYHKMPRKKTYYNEKDNW